jgi:hypothetical protein
MFLKNKMKAKKVKKDFKYLPYKKPVRPKRGKYESPPFNPQPQSQTDRKTLADAKILAKNFKGAYGDLKKAYEESEKFKNIKTKRGKKTYISTKTGASLDPYFDKATDIVGKGLTSVGVPQGLAGQFTTGAKAVTKAFTNAIDRPYEENGKVYVPSGPGSGVRNYRKPGFLF